MAPGLRERKKLETRRRIETVALELFERSGFDATTIDEIAAAADIAPRTFFHYFRTKEDVVLAGYSERLNRLLAMLSERPADEPPWVALRRSFQAVAGEEHTDGFERRRRLTLMTAAPSVLARNLQLQDGWERELAATLANRWPETDELTARLMAAAALAATRAAVRHWLSTPDAPDLPTCLDTCFEHLGHGLAPPDPANSAPPSRRQQR